MKASKEILSSGIRVIAILVVLTLMLVLVLGMQWYVWVIIGLIGFLFITILPEYITVKLSNGKNDISSGEVSEVGNTVSHSMKIGQFNEFWWFEKECYGTVIMIGDRRVLIDLRCDHLLEQRKCHIVNLVTKSDSLEINFLAFKAMEARRKPKDAELILNLEIELIGFYSDKDARVGEVCFTGSRGEELCSCLLDDDKFVDLLTR